MRDKLFVLLLCMIPATRLRAQHFMTGLSLGPVVSDVQGTDTRDYDNDFAKLGYTGGLFVNRTFGRNDILQLEINYIQKGAEQTPDSTNNGFFKLVLNYVEVPLVWRHRIRVNMNRKFYNNFEWELGASGGYLFSFSQNVSGYNLPLDRSSLNSVDISAIFGINYLISRNWYFGVRYTNSVIPVLRRNAIPAQVLSSYPLTFNNGNNRVLEFCLRYVFGGGRGENY